MEEKVDLSLFISEHQQKKSVLPANLHQIFGPLRYSDIMIDLLKQRWTESKQDGVAPAKRRAVYKGKGPGYRWPGNRLNTFIIARSFGYMKPYARINL